MPNGSIKIFKTEVKPGKKTVVNIDIAKLHTRTPLDVPVIIQRAKKEGPNVLIIGGIHGDEVNGVEIVRQIIKNKYNVPERGMVICIPVINIFGFLNQTREFPDGRDLNRSFPGSTKGSLASRFAHFLVKEICPHVDYILDFHTGGAQRFNYSQIRINNSDAEAFELAKVFGTKFILKSDIRDKSFRDIATGLGKKVLMFEGGKSMNLDKKVTQSGLEGTIRLLHQLELRDYSEQISSFDKQEKQFLITQSSWVRAKYSGMYRSYKSIGTKVNKGDLIGSITDPYGDFEYKIKAPWSGYIICSNHSPMVNQGDAITHISKEFQTI